MLPLNGLLPLNECSPQYAQLLLYFSKKSTCEINQVISKKAFAFLEFRHNITKYMQCMINAMYDKCNAPPQRVTPPQCDISPMCTIATPICISPYHILLPLFVMI